LHVGLLLLILSGDRHDGIRVSDAPASVLVQLEAREADRSDIMELPLPELPIPIPASDEQLPAVIASLALPLTDVIIPHPAEFTPPSEPRPRQ
jgi:hypothetical protein